MVNSTIKHCFCEEKKSLLKFWFELIIKNASFVFYVLCFTQVLCRKLDVKEYSMILRLINSILSTIGRLFHGIIFWNLYSNVVCIRRSFLLVAFLLFIAIVQCHQMPPNATILLKSIRLVGVVPTVLTSKIQIKFFYKNRFASWKYQRY